MRHHRLSHDPGIFLVVAYDVEDDGRRDRLHQTLKAFGDPVQYSVFECLLMPSKIREMRGKAKEIIKPGPDRVRYYYLCRRCALRTMSIPEDEQKAQNSVLVI